MEEGEPVGEEYHGKGIRMKKGFGFFILIAGILFFMAPAASYAGYSHTVTENGGYQLSVECTKRNSRHTITAVSDTYPAGTATIYYYYDGRPQPAYHPPCTSYQSYWSTSYDCPGEMMYVETTAYGETVRTRP